MRGRLSAARMRERCGLGWGEGKTTCGTGILGWGRERGVGMEPRRWKIKIKSQGQRQLKKKEKRFWSTRLVSNRKTKTFTTQSLDNTVNLSYNFPVLINPVSKDVLCCPDTPHSSLGKKTHKYIYTYTHKHTQSYRPFFFVFCSFCLTGHMFEKRKMNPWLTVCAFISSFERKGSVFKSRLARARARVN